jgi:hypothetical protein
MGWNQFTRETQWTEEKDRKFKGLPEPDKKKWLLAEALGQVGQQFPGFYFQR